MKKIIIAASIILFTVVIAFAWPYPTETVPQTQTILNSYFVNGAYPNETNYAELIDTMFVLANQEYTNALAMESNAVIAQKYNPILATVNMAVTNAAPWVFLLNTNNIASVSVREDNTLNRIWMTNYFVTPMANTNFLTVKTSSAEDSANNRVFVFIEQKTNYVAFYYQNNTVNPSGDNNVKGKYAFYVLYR